jgi:IMP cyclohydrolase
MKMSDVKTEWDLSALEKMVYPGRFMIVGKSENGLPVVIYGLTGRSTSSKARRLVSPAGDLRVSTEPTDMKELEKGDPALLLYDAILSDGKTTVVSNGAQTNLIQATMDTYAKAGVSLPLNLVLPVTFSGQYRTNLMKTRDGRTIDLTIHEPDDPIYTPRISAVTRDDYVMFSIARRDANGHPVMAYYELRLDRGVGKLVATYDGPNPEKPTPVPSFKGEPRDIGMGWFNNPTDTAGYVYRALNPDFAVSVACFSPTDAEGFKIRIKNLHEKGE